MPSASASVFDAVRVSPWVAVPVMVTPPERASFTLAIALVAVEVADSAVPWPSV